jgi:hypothetical protein
LYTVPVMIKFREVLVIRDLISSDPFVRLGHGRGHLDGKAEAGGLRWA